MRRAALAALAGLSTTLGGCADILGLEDPAGRLGEGGSGSVGVPAGSGASSTGTGAGAGTGAGPGTGSGPGAGGGSSTSSSGSTGTGGGVDPGALALPEGFAIHALGTSDDGALALVRRTNGSDGTLCGETVAGERLAAVAIDAPQCSVLTTLSGNNPIGFSIEQRGSWLGFTSNDAGTATTTLHTPTPMTVTSAVEGGMRYALWNVETPGTGFLRATVQQTLGARIEPQSDGSALVLQNTMRVGFAPNLLAPCEAATVEGPLAVHFLNMSGTGGGCVIERPVVVGDLLDHVSADPSWSLIQTADNCAAYTAEGDVVVEALGACMDPAHLLRGPGASLFLGTSSSALCSDAAAGVIGNLTGLAEAIWCDAPGGNVIRVIPFFADETHVRFVHVTAAETSELRRVAIDGGRAEEPQELCDSCTVRDAVTSSGVLYVTGLSGGAATSVFGVPIPAFREFWAWRPLDDL